MPSLGYPAKWNSTSDVTYVPSQSPLTLQGNTFIYTPQSPSRTNYVAKLCTRTNPCCLNNVNDLIEEDNDIIDEVDVIPGRNFKVGRPQSDLEGKSHTSPRDIPRHFCLGTHKFNVFADSKTV